jgi:hypothetical protein
LFKIGSRPELRARVELVITATGAEFEYELAIEGNSFEEARQKWFRELNLRYATLPADGARVGIEVQPLSAFDMRTPLSPIV